MILANDFIQYWAAFQVAGAGANPYDPEQIHQIQAAFSMHKETPLMMWLPPWALLWLAPILLLPLQLSAFCWFVFNVLFFVISVEALCDFFDLKKIRGLAWVPFLFFLPILLSISIGQISIFLCFGLGLVLSGLKHYSAPRQAIGCLILSLKPHLFLVFAAWFLLRQVRNREFAWAFYFSIFFISSLLGTYLLFPVSLAFWWESLFSPLPGAISKLHWLTHSIPSWIRFYLSDQPKQLLWPLLLFPLLSVLFVAIYFYRWRENVSAQRDRKFVLLSLGLSFVFAPFAWIYDAVMLLPHFLVSLEFIRRLNKRMTLFTLLILGVIAFIQVCLPLSEPVLQLWWYPVLIALSGLYCFKQKLAVGN